MTVHSELAVALGKIPSGLFVLTTNETGMLASWVQQCSFDPPQITVAVRKGRSIAEALAPGIAFAINVVPESQKALIVHYGKGFDPGQPAFNGIELFQRDESAPILTAALASLDCRVVELFDGGDHHIVIGRVINGFVHQPDAKPSVHIRKNGLTY